MLALTAGLAMLFLLPHPWNGVGFTAAMIWQIMGILYGLRWSQRDAPLVGTNTLVGLDGVVVEACQPQGRVKIGGETWRACSRSPVEPGVRVRVLAVDGLTLHVESETL